VVLAGRWYKRHTLERLAPMATSWSLILWFDANVQEASAVRM
jgi:hypothetical protein